LAPIFIHSFFGAANPGFRFHFKRSTLLLYFHLYQPSIEIYLSGPSRPACSQESMFVIGQTIPEVTAPGT